MDALGLEALSRGAAEVVFVERAAAAVNMLRRNVAALEAEGATVLRKSASEYLAADDNRPFDIVFLDPPFRQDLLAGSIRLLEENGWLAADAWIYLESERGVQPELPANWEVYREKQAGQVGYRLIRRRPA